MIRVLDTNVLSALMDPERHAPVVAWLDRQAPDGIFTTAVSVFEIGYGLALLPAGKRRMSLEALFTRLVQEALDARVLPFDALAAQEAGRLMALRQAQGRPVGTADTQIAAIALAHGACVVTRNVRHFADVVTVEDPWQPVTPEGLA